MDTHKDRRAGWERIKSEETRMEQKQCESCGRLKQVSNKFIEGSINEILKQNIYPNGFLIHNEIQPPESLIKKTKEIITSTKTTYQKIHGKGGLRTLLSKEGISHPSFKCIKDALINLQNLNIVTHRTLIRTPKKNQKPPKTTKRGSGSTLK